MLTIDYISRHFDRFRVPVLSPLISLLRAGGSRPIAHRHLLVSASGLMATARKADARRTQMNCPVCDESSFARLSQSAGRACMRCQGCGCVALESRRHPRSASPPEQLSECLSLYDAAPAPRFHDGSLLVSRRRRRLLQALLTRQRRRSSTPGAYDAACLLNQLQTHPAPGELLREVHAALRPGAPLLLTVPRLA